MVISLSVFAVEYPPLFGLCAIQLPMVSGFLNPLLYGIMWPPYRRAYIRALKWPGAKCCTRQTSSRARSHTLNCKYYDGTLSLDDNNNDDDDDDDDDDDISVNQGFQLTY